MGDFLTFVCDGDTETMEAVKQFCEQNNAVRSGGFDERIVKANELINQGNELFKTDDCVGAKQWYLAAAHHADFDLTQQQTLSVMQKMQIRGIMIRVLLNFSHNALKSEDFNTVRNSCSLGLQLAISGQEVPPDIIAKFLYRRARALFAQGNFKQCADDTKKALEFLPNDAAIKGLFAQAMAQVAKAEEGVKGKLSPPETNLPFEMKLPKVDLVLIDENGNRIKELQMSSPRARGKTEQSPLDALLELICCKRKRKQL